MLLFNQGLTKNSTLHAKSNFPVIRHMDPNLKFTYSGVNAVTTTAVAYSWLSMSSLAMQSCTCIFVILF